LWQVHAAVTALKEANPGNCVDVISQPSAVKALEALPEVDSVVEYPGEVFRLRNTPLRLLLKLRRAHYHTIVIVHNNVYGDGYHSVHFMAFIAGAPRVLAYNLDGEWAALRDTGNSPRALRPAIILAAACVAILTLLYLPFGIARALVCHASRRGRIGEYNPSDPLT
jgi:hypothetical protein